MDSVDVMFGDFGNEHVTLFLLCQVADQRSKHLCPRSCSPPAMLLLVVLFQGHAYFVLHGGIPLIDEGIIS